MNLTLTEQFNKIENMISEGHSFLILTHVNMDADAISSMLCMNEYLKYRDKEVFLYSYDSIPDNFKFLSGWKEIHSAFDVEGKFDTVIILDCGDLKRIGKFQNNLNGVKRIINIDHHPYNSKFGMVNCIDPEASATCQILYNFFEYTNFKINDRIATYIYAGMVSDTNCFKNGNVTRRVFQIVAAILEFNVNTSAIVANLFENYSDQQARLIGYIMSNFKKIEDYGIYWITISIETMKKFNLHYSQLDEMVSFLKLFKDINVAIIIKQIKEDLYRLNLRSKHGINIAEIALKLGGGGHRSAAACTVSGNVDEILNQVLELARGQVKKVMSSSSLA